jgi:hypothetical protein
MSTTFSRTILGVVLALCFSAFHDGSVPSSTVAAQETDAVQADDKEKVADARLDTVFRKWRKAEKAAPDRHFSFMRTVHKFAFGDKQVVNGEVYVHTPNLLRVDVKEPNSKLDMVLVCNSKSLRWYQFEKKEVISGDLPETFGFPEKPEQYPEGFLNEILGGVLEQFAWAFFGKLANDTTNRFRFTLQKEDKDWIYLTIEPRKRSKRVNFEAARVVLDADTYRVQQFWFRQRNGDTHTWDFHDADIDHEAVTRDSISNGLPEDFKNVTIPPEKPKKDAGKP